MQNKSDFFETLNIHDIDIYRHRLHVIVSTDPLASLKKHIKDYQREKPIRAMHIVLDVQGNSMILLPFDVTPGELAHECNHCVMHIIEEIGAGYKEEEYVCYLLSHLVDFASEDLVKAKKERKKSLDKSEER